MEAPTHQTCFFVLKINDERWSKLLWQNHGLQMRSVTVGNRQDQTYRVGKTRQRTKTGRKPVKTKSSRVCTRCRSTSLSEGGHTLWTPYTRWKGQRTSASLPEHNEDIIIQLEWHTNTCGGMWTVHTEIHTIHILTQTQERLQEK